MLRWEDPGMADRPGPTPPTPPADDPGDHWQRLTNTLPQPPNVEDRHDLLWQELSAQFGWYNRAATRTRLWYQVLKVAVLVAGASVTLLAAISAPAAVTASVAGVIVVVEGAQQIFQFHSNWISYRGSAELLRQHAFLYVASVTPYDQPTTRRARLAAALVDVATQEKSNWSKVMEQVPGKG
jgi:hypothetical protein